jgi:hypothetical protein
LAFVVIMSAGILDVIAEKPEIIRVVYISKTLQKPISEWNTLLFGNWTAVGLCVGLFCALAPATLPLLKKLVPRAMASLTGDTSFDDGYGKGASNSRVRARDGVIDLQNSQDLQAIGSSARVSKRRTMLKGWYSAESGGNESQEDVIARSGNDGITKTSEVVISESRLDGDED